MAPQFPLAEPASLLSFFPDLRCAYVCAVAPQFPLAEPASLLSFFPDLRCAYVCAGSFGVLTRSTGLCPPCSTLSVTLPKAHRLMPECPCVDIAIKSALISSATLSVLT